MFPGRRPLKTEVRHRPPRSGCPTPRTRPHLLHRQAALPRVPELLPRTSPARSGRARLQAGRARGPELLHAGPAPEPGWRRQERLPIAAVASTSPWFVAAKDLEKNTLIVVQARPPRCCFRPPWWPTTWAGLPARRRRMAYAAKRYRQADAPCALAMRGGACNCTSCSRSGPVTPGQSAVVW